LDQTGGHITRGAGIAAKITAGEAVADAAVTASQQLFSVKSRECWQRAEQQLPPVLLPQPASRGHPALCHRLSMCMLLCARDMLCLAPASLVLRVHTHADHARLTTAPS
jgi:hypothetical protein